MPDPKLTPQPGDVYRSRNGNLYLVTPGRQEVYIGNVDNHLHCVDAKTGQGIWRFNARNDLDSSPCVSGGKLYVGGENGYLHCLDPVTGKVIWRAFLGGLEGPPGSNGVES